jgi:hyperpolarization activated cyclic nucleotide-gated potassium channel 1
MVYENQDVASEIFFLVKGRVNLITTKLKIPYKTYITGSYFGEIEIIFKRNRTTYVLAEGDCDMLLLNKSYLE